MAFSPPYRSQYEGFPNSINTLGGYGATPIKVNNLNNSGPGSFRNAWESSASPKIIIFETSGNVNLTNFTINTANNVTLAGQTAPFPGITIAGDTVQVQNCSDVVVQHMRFRGMENSDDAFSVLDSSNVVLDHCSLSWSTDEIIEIIRSDDVTVWKCILSEPLNGPKPGHALGILMGSTDTNVQAGIAVLRSLYAHMVGRFPMRPRESGLDRGIIIANNLLYNRINEGMWFPGGINNLIWSIVGCRMKDGPSLNNPTNLKWFDGNTMGGGSETLLFDNSLNGTIPGDPWDSLIINDRGNWEGSRTDIRPRPWWPTSFNLLANTLDLETTVLDDVGARPISGERDATDTRIINNYINGTGAVINFTSEVGGLPSLAENGVSHTPPADPDNLHQWLEDFAVALEPGVIARFPYAVYNYAPGAGVILG